MAWDLLSPILGPVRPLDLLLAVLVVAYLFRVNKLLRGTPKEIRQLTGPTWTPDQLRKTYRDLQDNPIDYASKLPPKLDRRYIVTGGNGLAGGFIVLQLLLRGTPVRNIRIIEIRRPERVDMQSGPPSEVEFIPTDVRSKDAVSAAFNKSWDPSIAGLPLTVFHTAAIILASDRSKYLYAFPHAVNVVGTENVLAAAKAAGADVFSSTSSASISILPVNPWVFPWAKQPNNYWQLIDEKDFDKPLKPFDEFFGNYPASKAAAEKLVCAANSDGFRTGCIRPASGIYGNPTDNTVGSCLSREVFPTWVPHIVNNFVHGANVAIAHLQQEAVLLSKAKVSEIPQAGRPFVITDPNPPITFQDLYTAISTLSIHAFRTVDVPPVVMLLLSYVIEQLNILPYRIPALQSVFKGIKGENRHLQPGLFTICTHLVASDAQARKPMSEGGLGYEGVLTTMQGIALEVLEWNRDHGSEGRYPKDKSEIMTGRQEKKVYTTSATFADQLR